MTRTLKVALLATLTLTGGCLSAANDAAGRRETPVQVVRAFYELMDAQECDLALALRPDYREHRCSKFELIALDRVEEVASTSDTALVSISLTYRMEGKPAKAEGCVVTRRTAQGWYFHDYKAAPCTSLFGTALRVNPGPSAYTPQSAQGGVTGTTELDVGSPSGNELHHATPIVEAAQSAPGEEEQARPKVAESTEEDPPGGSESPRSTVQRYYEALNSGECSTVLDLRPGYEQCKSISSASVSELKEVLRNDEIATAVISFHLEYGRTGADGEKRETLEGLAWLERNQDRWTITQIYRQDNAGLVNQRFAEALAQGPSGANRSADASAQPAVEGRLELSDLSVLGQPSPDLPAPAAVEGPSLDWRLSPLENGSQRFPTPSADWGRSNDSEAILSKCWSKAELLGSASEKIIRKIRPPDPRPPPERWIRRAEVQRASFTGLPPGSIRWVDLDDRNATAIALTFDLCEQADEVAGYDPEIVNFLREEQLPATFFAGGKWMRSHRERAKQLILDPLFEVGNHTWTHGNLRVLQGDSMRNQILWTQAQYMELRDELYNECARFVRLDVLDRVPVVASTFRFPYGTCSNESLRALADFGIAAAQWDIVTGDPDRDQTAEGIANRIREGIKRGRGSIVIMHANGRGHGTAEALRLVVPKLKSQGVHFLTVTQLLSAGRPRQFDECFEILPGDNKHYDVLYGEGTGE